MSILDRVIGMRRQRDVRGAADAVPTPPDGGHDERLRALEEHVEHLQALVEGLQDALHRSESRQGEEIRALQEKTEPERLAQALSQNARERGL
jgi:vacuolar-type H+-ATPase subunit I/STV1